MHDLLGFQILTCVWDGLSEATCCTEEKKFTLDVCVWMEEAFENM